MAFAGGSDCPVLPDVTPGHCIATAEGWFYADSVAAAEQLAEDARETGRRFRRYFAVEPPQGAILAQHRLGTAQIEALRAAGAQWVLPWLDAAERQRLMEAGVRRAVVQQLGEAADERIVAQAVAQALAQRTQASVDDARGALRHEIGHMLLIHAYWPQARSRGNGQYGGPGPDWLDEAAAVLMENEGLTERRRMQLRALIDGNADSAGLLSLPAFLTAPHPLAAIARDLTDGAAGPDGASVTVLSGDDRARELAGLGAAFYVQSRAFADFLIETTGDEAVLGSIAGWIADGGTIDGWLTGRGAGQGLGATVEAMERQWLDWLSARP